MARVFTTETEETDEARRSRSRAPARLLRRAFGGWGGEEGWRSARTWRRGWVTAVLAVFLGLALMLHSVIPNTIGNLGSLWETFLPWGGLFIPVLLLIALIRRSVTALAALLVPLIAWLSLFGGLLTDRGSTGGDFTVVTHNVNAGNPDPVATARQLKGSGADVIALEEIAGRRIKVYERELADAYPYHDVRGTVGIWSAHPLRDSEPVDIGMGWTRALRTTVETPQGQVAVYVAHLPSVRVQFRSGFTAGRRDVSAEMLGQRIEDDPVPRLVLLGDLNGTMNDRALAPVTSQLRSTQGASGRGMGFSWPASFPMARIDQIMVKGLEPASSWTMEPTGSDHLPVAASMNFPK
ncbi:endonuclease/exonuclease/phosphatase family protein [Streptomyces sp. N2-109]|uniref:Endonuclease/exonuclease/phosphatase family protein n=1 Tax=Streptomyces gossypii TaxID=2883101 RepID=A0ABT2JRI4_9ACTN|nr:endonuclease/exonuclease/phosphatase family protein [Streptomyces gossypii]MCT2590104.1 endonuclease/exonuclease/phosphatase family protein [Streptomyces gossypii]